MTEAMPTAIAQVPTTSRKQPFAPEADVMSKCIDQALTWCDIQRAQGHHCTEEEVMATADRFYLKTCTHQTQPVPEHHDEAEEPPDDTPVDPHDHDAGP